jgi:lysophospholipase L1-like esterase
MSDAVVAFVGDSLTADGAWHEWFPNRSTSNFGVAGDTTDNLVERLPEIIAATPGTIALLIGTNDLVWRQSVEHVVRNIEMILWTLRRELPDARILVQSIPPREPEFAARIEDINRHVRQYAPTVKAQYLDLWPSLAEGDHLNPAYSQDGVTLNDAGYQAWLAELGPALESVESTPPTTRAFSIITNQKPPQVRRDSPPDTLPWTRA